MGEWTEWLAFPDPIRGGYLGPGSRGQVSTCPYARGIHPALFGEPFVQVIPASSQGVLAVEVPTQWIGVDVIADAIQGSVIPNYVLVVVALPDGDARRLTVFVEMSGREGLECPHDFWQSVPPGGRNRDIGSSGRPLG